jgi:hypothetical protein
MSGGAGHLADMNNRMKQNRSIRTSQKSQFKTNINDSIVLSNKPDILNFKKVSNQKLTQVKDKIKKKAKLERKRERIIIIAGVIVIIITAIFFCNY